MSEAEALRAHDESCQLLPWYQNGTLSPQDHARVEAHLADCPTCRRELSDCALLDEALAQEADAPPAPARLNRVLQRIETAEQRTAPGRRAPRRSRSAWREVRRPVRWLIAGQSLAIAGLIATLLIARGETPSEDPVAPYQTLTTAASPAAEDSVRLQVVFASEATQAELQVLLHGIDGSLVSGPSQRGVYELALPASSDLTSALDTLRGHPAVQLAEPLPAGARP